MNAPRFTAQGISIQTKIKHSVVLGMTAPDN